MENCYVTSLKKEINKPNLPYLLKAYDFSNCALFTQNRVTDEGYEQKVKRAVAVLPFKTGSTYRIKAKNGYLIDSTNIRFNMEVVSLSDITPTNYATTAAEASSWVEEYLMTINEENVESIPIQLKTTPTENVIPVDTPITDMIDFVEINY